MYRAAWQQKCNLFKWFSCGQNTKIPHPNHGVQHIFDDMRRVWPGKIVLKTTKNMSDYSTTGCFKLNCKFQMSFWSKLGIIVNIERVVNIACWRRVDSGSFGRRLIRTQRRRKLLREAKQFPTERREFWSFRFCIHTHTPTHPHTHTYSTT
jgi:hypothetical protein